MIGLFTERKKSEPNEFGTANLNHEDLENILNSKLDHDKIYLCEDLTLSMLAHELNIHSYQLSQFLNNHMGQNFNTLVNSYRIRDARHKLIHEQEKSILTIAFEVGFNSKASFNRVFKDITKMSPSGYRKFSPNLLKNSSMVKNNIFNCS